MGIRPSFGFGCYSAASRAGAGNYTEGNRLLPSLGIYKYYDFVETAPAGGQNFLITSVSGTTVPEPEAWTLMIAGFGGMGAMLRRRRALAAVA